MTRFSYMQNLSTSKESLHYQYGFWLHIYKWLNKIIENWMCLFQAQIGQSQNGKSVNLLYFLCHYFLCLGYVTPLQVAPGILTSPEYSVRLILVVQCGVLFLSSTRCYEHLSLCLTFLPTPHQPVLCLNLTPTELNLFL